MKWLFILGFISLCTAAPTVLDVGSSGTKIISQAYSSSMKAFVNGMGDQYLGMACAAVQSGKAEDFKYGTDDKNMNNMTGQGDQGLKKYVEEIFKDMVAHNVPYDPAGVVALATAGMRSPNVPDDMPNVCKYKFTLGGNEWKFRGGEWCRLTPGTDEAWYEWISVQTGIDKDTKKHATGGTKSTVSMGGASAQIAIPLTASQLVEFTKLMDEAKSHPEWFCTQTRPLPQNDTPEIFYKNFIDVRDPATDPKVKAIWKDLGQHAQLVKGKQPVVAVGVISFLAVDDRAKVNGANPESFNHIAGGNNVMALLLKSLLVNTNKCDSGYKCFEELKKLLVKDQFFKAVLKFIRDPALKLYQEGWVLLSNMNIRFSDNRKDLNEDLSYCSLDHNSVIQHGKKSGVIVLGKDKFEQCTNQLAKTFIDKVCPDRDSMLNKDIKGQNKCGNTLSRLAIASLLFGGASYDPSIPAHRAQNGQDTCVSKPGVGDDKHCATHKGKRPQCTADAKCEWGKPYTLPGLNMMLGSGDPALGAIWVLDREPKGVQRQQTADKYKTSINGGACVPKNRKTTKPEACNTKAEKDCKDPCQWRSQAQRQEASVAQSNKNNQAKQTAQAKKSAGLAKKLQSDEKNKQQACFGKAVAANRAGCEKLKQCFFNAQQNKCKPLGCGDADDETKCKAAGRMGCIWKDPGFCTVGPTRGSFFGGQQP